MTTLRTVTTLGLCATLLLACKPGAQTTGEPAEDELGEAAVGASESAGESDEEATTGPVSLVVSSTHGCARHGDGAVSCWPLPEYERDTDAAVRLLAEGPEVAAVRVAAIDDATALVAGDAFVCANREKGVDCWDPATATPAKVLETATHLDAFGATVCGSDGKTVVCATRGEAGFVAAEPITLPKEVVEVEVGGEALCVRYADDTAHCRSLAGGEGDPGLETGPTRDGKPLALENVSAIEAGEDHVCARIEETYHCWGDLFGNVTHAIPAREILLFPGARISHVAGREKLRDSIVADRPKPGRGEQLGPTSLATSALLTGLDATKDPTERFSPDRIGFHTGRLCVIQPDGAIACAIDHSDFTSRNFAAVQPPLEAPAAARFEDVTVAGPVTYALDDQGSLWAMGVETRANRRFPGWWSGLGYSFLKPTNLGLSPIEALHSIRGDTFIRTEDRWEQLTGRTSLPEPMQAAPRLLSTSGRLICTPGEPGSVDCTDTMSWTLREVDLPAKLSAVATPSDIRAACFLDDAGEVYCDMTFFEAGGSEAVEPRKPTKVGLSGVTHMVSTGGGICVAKAAEGKSEIHCGDVTNDGGAPRADLQRVATLGQVEKLEAGAGAICAIFGEGELTCWGTNSKLTLHDELAVDERGVLEPSTPADGMAKFAVVAPVSDVALGEASACAVTVEGKLWCWGVNAAGGTGRVPPYVSKVVFER